LEILGKLVISVRTQCLVPVNSSLRVFIILYYYIEHGQMFINDYESLQCGGE